MFVRFRERINDGRQPDFIESKLQCAGRCRPGLRDRRAGPGARYFSGCPFKPRCRWRIKGDLVPYRLLVGLIENQRVDGKVRQTHVADLGAIDGYMLPSFFSEPMPAEWHVISISARLAFWNVLDERLMRLSNRISTEDAAKVRDSIQTRVPRPTAEDISQLEAWKAMQEVVEWENLRGGFQNIIDNERESIAVYEGYIEKAKGSIGSLLPVIGEVNSNVRKVQQRLAEGDRSIVEKSCAARKEVSLGLGEILGARLQRPTPEELADWSKRAAQRRERALHKSRRE
jgi:hypothetical protein